MKLLLNVMGILVVLDAAWLLSWERKNMTNLFRSVK